MTQQACSTCGNATRVGADGHCPACLIRLALEPAASVPPYQIVSPLGEGPAGATFAAQELGTSRLLAIKVVGPEASHDVVNHNCVAESLGIDVADNGEVRLVRAFVRGKPLPVWLADASREARAKVLEQIRDAVAAIHAAGLTHGHLTPSNVIVEADDTPVIVDLGCGAASLDDDDAVRELERLLLTQ